MELILMIRFFTILTIYFLFTSCGMVVSKLIPFTDLPKPIGKYNIGTKIETWIDYKRTNEVDPMRLRPHPYEFHLYFDA